MIQLDRFTETHTLVAPIINGTASVNGRKLYFHKKGTPILVDGWYEIELGNEAKIVKLASPLQIRRTLGNRKSYRGYAMGNELIPLNFDNLKRKGFEDTISVYFMQARAWDVVEAVLWEDRNFYFKQTCAVFDPVLKAVKERYENDQQIGDIKSVSPEQKYLFLVLNLQRQSIRHAQELERFALAEKERAKRLAEFQSTFSGRLQSVVESTGAKLIKWEKRGDNFLVTWSLGGQEIKSIIKDTMRVISAGFCVSSYDVFHTLNSLPNLLKIYQAEDSVVITRN